MSENVITSAPGRICLFGEHQDYLGLPVVAMAIDRRFVIEYHGHKSREFLISTPDLEGSEPQTLDIHSGHPRHDQDYCWGIAQVLKEEGFIFSRGGEVTFRSEIPVRAGCSSSSAMSSAWMRLLLEIGEHKRKDKYLKDPELVAHLVFKGEKELFGGAGGMMDQYSCYLGGLIHVFPVENSETGIPYAVEKLSEVPTGFILIDSGQPKDTQGVLKAASERVHRAMADVKNFYSDFDLREIELAPFDELMDRTGSPGPGSATARIVRDHIINRDLCRHGLAMLRLGVNEKHMGELLNEEHRVLSETLGISTKLIDDLHRLSLEAGALGGKINGSGGGGTLFCYAPHTGDQVAEALRRNNTRFFHVVADEGARIEFKGNS